MGLFFGFHRGLFLGYLEIPNGLPWLGCLGTLQVKIHLGGYLWAYIRGYLRITYEVT